MAATITIYKNALTTLLQQRRSDKLKKLMNKLEKYNIFLEDPEGVTGKGVSGEGVSGEAVSDAWQYFLRPPIRTPIKVVVADVFKIQFGDYMTVSCDLLGTIVVSTERTLSTYLYVEGIDVIAENIALTNGIFGQ